MKIFKTLTIFLFLIMPFLVQSQNEKVVENINWRFDGQKMIINYDLLSPDGKSRTYDISLEVDVNGEIIRPQTGEGVVGLGQQVAQKGKTIDWYFTRMGKSTEDLDVDGLRVRVFAENPNPPIEVKKTLPPPVVKEEKKVEPPIFVEPSPREIVKTPKKPSLILPIVTSTVGLGLVGYGFVVEGEAKDLYDIYKAHTVESDQRESDYQAANDKHKTAQYISIGGGVFTGVGAYLLYRTFKKRKDSGGFTVIPELDSAPLYGSYGGVGVRYSF